MVEELILRDFQRHTRFRLRLGNSVTVVTGGSDRGKSAVLRALRWVSANRPQGMTHVRHGAKFAKVTVCLDGRTVKRVRGKGKNAYYLDGRPLKAFGDKVPEEVERLFHLSDINFQGQHDAPFWFSDTPGEVSKKLNAVINLSVIDSTLAHLNARLRAISGEERVTESRVEQYRTAKQELLPVLRADADLKRAEALERKRAEACLAADELGQLVANAAQHAERCDRASGLQTTGLAAVTAMEAWAGVYRRMSHLEGLLYGAEELRAKAQTQVPSLDALEQDYARAAIAQKKVEDLQRLVVDAVMRRDIVRSGRKLLAALERQITEAIGERCPLCRQRVTR